MCVTCGCGTGDIVISQAQGGDVAPHDHDHSHHDHSHHDHHHHDDHHHQDGHHHHAHPAPDRTHGSGRTRLVEMERDILAKNDAFARENRARFEAAGLITLNLLSGPGAGKTTLLVETLRQLGGQVPAAVIEGDQRTENDAERIRATGTPAVQINTGKGCHLDAHMVGHAAQRLVLPVGGVLFIENVGNLVCPAAFDLGEDKRVTLLSITEGEDKPLKYPDIFETADVVLLTKTDLIAHLDVDIDLIERNVARINPLARIIRTFARGTGGLEAWLTYLSQVRRERLDRLARQSEDKARHLRAAAEAIW